MSEELWSWLDANADRLDTTPDLAGEIVPRLAAAGLFRAGVPEDLGGRGGSVLDAIDAISLVAEHSVTAAFVFWGQRTFIEYLLQSPNEALRARWIGPLLDGSLRRRHRPVERDEIPVRDRGAADHRHAEDGEGWRLDGGLAWITNLRKEGFIAAAAVTMPKTACRPWPPSAVQAGCHAHARPRPARLRSSNTAAIPRSKACASAPPTCCTKNARAWLPGVRPAFLGMQCGCRSAWRAPACAPPAAVEQRAVPADGAHRSAAARELAERDGPNSRPASSTAASRQRRCRCSGCASRWPPSSSKPSCSNCRPVAARPTWPAAAVSPGAGAKRPSFPS
jgi:hypothetical protein